MWGYEYAGGEEQVCREAGKEDPPWALRKRATGVVRMGDV